MAMTRSSWGSFRSAGSSVDSSSGSTITTLSPWARSSAPIWSGGRVGLIGWQIAPAVMIANQASIWRAELEPITAITSPWRTPFSARAPASRRTRTSSWA